jgi:hypothetical protein
MKSFRLAIVIAVAISCLCRVSAAQNVYGSTTIDIDPNSGNGTATCETDFDGAMDGNYEAQVVCTVTDQNGTQVASGDAADIDDVGYAQVVLTFSATPGSTYTARGIHHAIAILVEQQFLKTVYEDPYNFSSFESDGNEIYPNYNDWYGPGPEEETNTASMRLGETWAAETDPQIPGALSVLSSPAITYKTPYANGCPVTAPYGASLAITYQVLDSSSQHAAIANSNMEPQEQTSSLVINGVASGPGPVPNWQDIGPSTYSVDGSPVPGTSKFTNTQGQFLDAAFQECATGPVTVTVTQTIRILVGESAYVVRTNNWSVSSTSIGHGSISNGSDIKNTY